VLRGSQREDWMSYLDAAGYPKESRLPANFPTARPTPLTEARQHAGAYGRREELLRRLHRWLPSLPTRPAFKF
jgi:hypothetical protein